MTEVSVNAKKTTGVRRPVQFYIRDAKGFPVACVYAIPETDGSYAVGFSVHNPHDRYDRDLGRKIATGRATACAAKPRLVYAGAQSRSSFHTEIVNSDTKQSQIPGIICHAMVAYAGMGVIDIPDRVLKSMEG